MLGMCLIFWYFGSGYRCSVVMSSFLLVLPVDPLLCVTELPFKLSMNKKIQIFSCSLLRSRCASLWGFYDV